jgi:hypothetical protein
VARPRVQDKQPTANPARGSTRFVTDQGLELVRNGCAASIRSHHPVRAAGSRACHCGRDEHVRFASTGPWYVEIGGQGNLCLAISAVLCGLGAPGAHGLAELDNPQELKRPCNRCAGEQFWRTSCQSEPNAVVSDHVPGSRPPADRPTCVLAGEHGCVPPFHAGRSQRGHGPFS